jgi:hypothetical protein
MYEMHIDTLNVSGACSSLILYGFDDDLQGDNDVDNFPSFKEELIADIAGYWDGYVVQDFAFMTASTSHHQPVAEECLRKLGFTKSERVKKNKNPNHEVKFWVISIPLLFSNLGLEH